MLFADSILDSRTAGRGWTTLLSYRAQAILVGLLVVAPMLTSTVLPTMRMSAPLVVRALGDAPRTPPTKDPGHTYVSHGEVFQETIHAPGHIPEHIPGSSDDVMPPSIPGSSAGNQGRGLPGDPNGLLWAIADGRGAGPTLANPSAPLPRPRVSQPSPADLISGPRPQYPATARLARIEGVVVLNAVIARDGSIQHLQALSGHPMLVPAALDAVRQWRYRPYLLNGEPVEVETQITVNFTLGR
jgi:protein TonB